MADNGQHVADASPSKELFIDMLTRDIALSECILDLIDNSIHSLVRTNKLDVMDHLLEGTEPPKLNNRVDIHFSEEKFLIKDNCGGISLRDAEEQVFLLGKPTQDKKHAGLGVYGIGMKRAFFKIGKNILVRSETSEEEFEVPIDVEAWKRKPQVWHFPIENIRKRKAKTGNFSLEVKELTESTKLQFAITGFKRILMEKIALAYALFIGTGLDITVNGTRVVSNLPKIAESERINSVRHSWKKDGVDILIMADASPKKFGKPGGWYIFCNGRMILEADKSEKTGWGVGEVPEFHPKYNRFLGYVYFRAKDLWKLPWTTTKEGVVLESPIYQEALSEMEILSRPILNFFNDLYGPDREEGEAEREVLNEAKPVDPKEIASRSNTTFEAKPKKKADDDLVNIQYKRPRKKIKKIGIAIGNPAIKASQVGELTFDDFFDRNC